jgi:2'-5' RNA ligase
MRLFIAFDVSEEVREHILKLQKQLTGARLTLTRSFHLTLKFLGEVTPAQVEDVKKKLANVKFVPFTAKLDGTGTFPSDKMIRVVWAEITPHDIIRELQKQIDEALQGMFPKEKQFTPHLTIARVKTVENKEQFAEQVKKIKVEPISFEVKEFKLIESKLSQKGSEYKTIAEYR